jgi:O-antigen/teichoic acid export membrane protein
MDGFGVYALVTTLLGMNGLAAFGLTDAVTKFIAEQCNMEKVRLLPMVQTASALYSGLSLFFSVALFLSASSLIDWIFKVDHSWRHDAVQSLQIGAAAFGFRLMESFAGSISLGFSRYDLINKVDIASGVFLVGVQTLILLGGHGLVPLVGCIIPVAVTSMLIKFVLAAPLVGGFTAFFPILHASSCRRLLRFSAFTWLQSINQILSGQADRLLIAAILGTPALSYYIVCTRVASLVQILPARATSFVFPLASAQHASGELPQLRKTYFTAQNFTIILSLVLATPLFLFAPAILTIWIGESTASTAAGLLRILIVTYALLAGSILPFYYLNGAGLPGLNAAFGWAGSALNAMLLFLLLPLFQIVGAAMAKLASHSLSLICYPILHRRVFQDHRWYVGFLVILPPVIVFSLLTLCMGSIEQPSDLASLVVLAGASALTAAAVAVPLVFFINPVLGTPITSILRQLVGGLRYKIHNN